MAPSIREIRKAQEEHIAARLALGPLPINPELGPGMGSFAEDDPEAHEAMRAESERLGFTGPDDDTESDG